MNILKKYWPWLAPLTFLLVYEVVALIGPAQGRGLDRVRQRRPIVGRRKVMTEQKHTTTISEATAVTGEKMLKFFAYEHLPPALQEVSRPFGELAIHISHSIASSAERTVALRKLLESKDAAVRACLP